MGMSKAEEEEQARLERARAVGLFRYMLIREAADPALSSRQRGKMVRQIAAREHTDPSGRPVRLTRWTLDVWIRRWRHGGFDALVPAPRQCQPRTPPEVMELAAALKKENPARTAAQVQRILKAQAGWAPDETTIRRMFTRTGLTALTPAADAPAFGRWEASRPNEIWTGDAMHAIRLQGRKTYLFAFIDDHSRAVMAARFGFAEDTIRLAAALRPALASRGIPALAYVDNGSAFVDAWLLRACAKLGIKLVHSQPRRPLLTGQSLDRLPVTKPHLSRPAWPGCAWVSPACRLDRGGSGPATGVPCLIRNRCGCKETGNGGGSRAGGGLPTGSCATTTSATWPTGATPRPASAPTRSTCCTSPAGSPGRTSAWTWWTPTCCCATWPPAGPSDATASTTT